MPGPPPAVAATRVAVRRWLGWEGLPAGALVLVACSGGADSLALAAACGFVAPRAGLRVAAVVIDHGLQDGSAAVAARVVEQLGGLEEPVPAEVVQVVVGQSPAGPEADAREARYAALADTAYRLGAAVVLVGHTRDDQAEQVLLGLARGSGARSLGGMAPRRALGRPQGNHPARSVGVEGNHSARSVGNEDEVVLGRPFLGVTRVQTVAACAELGVEPWADPHNDDERFARVRARRALADLDAALGPGLAAGLARTADLLREDAAALEELSEAAYRDLGEQPWAVAALTKLPRAVRTRLWRHLALAAGSPGTDLTSEHLKAVDTLVTAWRGQGPLPLPGGVRAHREGGRVTVAVPRHTVEPPDPDRD